MTSRRVVCTGIGMISPLGVGAARSWSKLLQATKAVGKLRNEHLFEGCQSRIAAYVPEDDLNETFESPDHVYTKKISKQLSRPIIFAMLAAHEALKDADLLNTNQQLREEFREICGVTIGQGMVDFQDVYDNARFVLGETQKNFYRKISPFFMTRALINMSAGNVSIRYKIKGPNHCASTACATGAHSLGDAYNLIRNNKANIMVCGSTEAAINRLSIAGFDRLRALCTDYNDDPQAASRPFDEKRCGFVIGEGAGVIVLEELEHAKARGVENIYGEILGYGMSADAHNLTAPSPDGSGAKRCMLSALEDANLNTSDISHINAHATSTPLGDDIECNAIEELFFNSERANSGVELTVTSCKGSIGHLLGGAGSVEAVISLLSCQQALLPPSVNLEQPLPTPKDLIQFIKDEPRTWNCDRRILLKNSFGFGGTNASLVISNYINK